MSTELEKLLWRLRARHAAWQKETGAKDGSIFLWAADALDAAQERERAMQREIDDLKAFIRGIGINCQRAAARAALGEPNASS